MEVKKEPDTEANQGKPYDAQIAIEDAEQRRNEVIFTFPHTTVLYLRCNKNTSSRMNVAENLAVK